MRRLVALIALAALGILAPQDVESEPAWISVSATQTVQSVTLPAYAQNVTVISDGVDTCYFRLFTDVDTAGNATTSSMPLKMGESLQFDLIVAESPTTTFPEGRRSSESFNSAGKRARYYKSMSVICATGKTATWRVYAK